MYVIVSNRMLVVYILSHENWKQQLEVNKAIYIRYYIFSVTQYICICYDTKCKCNIFLSLIMNVVNVSGYWEIENASVSWNNKSHEMNMKKVSAPRGFSYHCSSLEKLVTTDHNFTMSLEGFQVSSDPNICLLKKRPYVYCLDMKLMW